MALFPPKHDLNTYMGRVAHFADVTDPRTLFYSKTELYRCKLLIQEALKKRSQIPKDKFYQAQKLVNSSFHPDTGEMILLPFRMSSFVPTNLIVVAGMLMPNLSRSSTIFWQWINQSINVAFNYCNANKSTALPLKDASLAYGVSVAASCGIALALHPLSARGGLLGRLVPFAAVAAAGTANVFLMRQNELLDGISIYDADDSEKRILGKSKTAAKDALAQVAISRVATSFPCMALTPIAMTVLQKTKFLKSRPSLTQPLNICLIGTSLMVALPFAIGLFPQEAIVNVRSLEKEFHNLVSPNGSGSSVTHVKYNKGL